MATPVTAKNFVIKFNNKVFGCAQSANLSTKREMVDVNCQATANFKSQVPGAESWDGSVTAIVRTFTDAAEESANVSLREMYTILREGALVEVEYEIGTGTTVLQFSSNAYLSNVDISNPGNDGVVTWTANLVGNTPLELA